MEKNIDSMVHINLLPQGNAEGIRKRKISGLLQTSLLVTLLAVGMGTFGLWVGTQTVLRQLHREEENIQSLEQAVGSHSNVEQQRQFLSDRLGKVADILSHRKTMESKIDRLATVLPENSSILSIKLSEGTSAIDMKLSTPAFANFEHLFTALQSAEFSRLVITKTSRRADGVYIVDAVGEFK